MTSFVSVFGDAQVPQQLLLKRLSLADVASLSRTCRKLTGVFHERIEALTCLDFQTRESWSHLVPLLRKQMEHMKNLRRVKMSCVDLDPALALKLDLIASGLEHLKCLSLSITSDVAWDQALQWLSPKLQSLIIETETRRRTNVAFGAWSTNLQHLEITGPTICELSSNNQPILLQSLYVSHLRVGPRTDITVRHLKIVHLKHSVLPTVASIHGIEKLEVGFVDVGFAAILSHCSPRKMCVYSLSSSSLPVNLTAASHLLQLSVPHCWVSDFRVSQGCRVLGVGNHKEELYDGSLVAYGQGVSGWRFTGAAAEFSRPDSTDLDDESGSSDYQVESDSSDGSVESDEI